jgi:hypothetical protein
LFIGIKLALFDVRQKAVGDFYTMILNTLIVVGVTRFSFTHRIRFAFSKQWQSSVE